MNQSLEMFYKVTSSRHHDKMIRSAEPLKNHLAVNHFWYDKVSYDGYYSYFGTHTEWSEYCTGHIEFLHDIPHLSKPNLAVEGIHLLGLSPDKGLQNVLECGRSKYNIHFNLHIVKKTGEGVESYGFGTSRNDIGIYERLLNETPLLLYYIKMFREINASIFEIVNENAVNILDFQSSKFTTPHKDTIETYNRELLLSELGIHFAPLSPREEDVLRYLANGFPASYIAAELALSSRTVESIIISLKTKLQCDSKVELIQKSQIFVTVLLPSL